jgi:hypothetical protein
MLRVLRVVFVFGLGCAFLPGCVVYEPYPGAYGAPSTYDRAWSAALGAVQDAGVQVTSMEPSTGQIRGVKDGINVNVSVLRQADGRTRVQFDSTGPTERDPGLSNRFSEAYERRMGR